MRCIVDSCQSNENKREGAISFHRFPEFKWKRDQWISALKLKVEDVNQRSIVCSLHFRGEDFHADSIAGRGRLKPCAIPYLEEDPLNFDHNDILESGDEILAEEHLIDDYPLENPSEPVTKDLAITLMGFRNISNQTSSLTVPCSCVTSKVKNPLKDTEEITPLSEPLKRAKELEEKVIALQRAVVERDRIIKLLNTKLRFKSERIINLVSKLKRNIKRRQKTKVMI